jgi:hypothetical protein
LFHIAIHAENTLSTEGQDHGKRGTQQQLKVIGGIPCKARRHIAEHHLNVWQHKAKGEKKYIPFNT